jgi:biopolymer transport protein ExbB
MPPAFMSDISSRLSQGQVDEAIRLSEARDSVFSRVVAAGLRKAHEFPDQIRDAMDSTGRREASHLRQKISYLANIGVIAPMVGLLGTVWGMILAFGAIKDQASRHVALAGALYKAMTTTVAGLLIGIVAMVFYFWLRGRVLRLTTEMEETSEKVAEAIISVGEMQ